MDYKKLGVLNDALATRFSDYVSMIATGSIITGDPFIEGRSDRDILLVFENDPLRDLGDTRRLLTLPTFDESYVFTRIKRSDWGQADSKYAFSNRFRSKTLFGLDLVPRAQLPDKGTTRRMYLNGLEDVSQKLAIHLDNSVFWSQSKVRDKFWKQFKHAFMFLAVRDYYLTGNYPKTRKELAERLKSSEIDEAFVVLHSIDQQPKERIECCAKGLVNYLKDL